MTKRQLEKVRAKFENLDLSRYHPTTEWKLQSRRATLTGRRTTATRTESIGASYSTYLELCRKKDEEFAARMESELNLPKGNVSSHTKINWNEIKSGAADILFGLGAMVFSPALASCGAGFILFPEGLMNFCYGMAEIGTGLQGGSLPSSTDLLIEQVSFGLAQTGFDRRN